MGQEDGSHHAIARGKEPAEKSRSEYVDQPKLKGSEGPAGEEIHD